MDPSTVESTLLKLALLAVTILFVVFQARIAKGTIRNSISFALFVLGISAWWNFSLLRGDPHVHFWEQYHYVLTGKYFDEIRYDGLYRCSMEALLESSGNSALRETPFRDLSDNRYRTLREQVALHGTCRSRFEGERWSAWKADVNWFHAAVGARWNRMLFDHGCNASPIWLFIAGLWLHDTPVSRDLLVWNLCLDLIGLLVMWVALAASIGIGPVSIAAVLWGTNVLGGEQWTGGAFLRKDWLIAMGLSLAVLKRKRLCEGAVLLSVAIASRILPVLNLAALVALRKGRSLRYFRNVFSALVILIGITSVSPGLKSWSEFIGVLAKHQATEGGNVVGLPRLVDNIVMCRYGTAGRSDGSCDLPEFRELTFESLTSRALSLAIGLILICGILWRTRALAVWEQLAFFSLGYVALTDIASYDTEIFAFAGLLALSRPILGVILLCGQILIALTYLGQLQGNSFYLVSSGLLVLTTIVCLVHGDWQVTSDENEQLL